MNRREALILSLLAGGSAVTGPARAATATPCARETDGTPAQFVPKKPADTSPQDNDVEKYPNCPYCGMDRRYNHKARMLIHYGNDLPDPLCSIHCGTISLAINLALDPKVIYVADNAVDVDPRPLIDAERATFLVGSDLPGVMTWNSKVAYGSSEAAAAAQKAHGGNLMTFAETLKVSFADLADDLERMRKARTERRRRATQKAAG